MANEKTAEWIDLIDANTALAALTAERDAAVEENTRLMLLLNPMSINSKKLTENYPSTIEEVLHLLSCYWADVTPFAMLFDDEYFGAWERIAKPIIEKLIGERDALAEKLDFLKSFLQMHSPKMDGSHSYRFRSGWPLNEMRGSNVDEAIEAGVAVVRKHISEAKASP